MWSNFAATLYEGRTRTLDKETFRDLRRRLDVETRDGTFLLGDSRTVEGKLAERGFIAGPVPRLHVTPQEDDGTFVRATVDGLTPRAKTLIEAYNGYDLRLFARYAGK